MALALLAEEIEKAAMRLSWIAFGDFAISRVVGLLAGKGLIGKLVGIAKINNRKMPIANLLQ